MATVYPFRQLTNAGQGPLRNRRHSFSALYPHAPSHTVNLKPGIQSEGLDSRLMHLEATAREKCFAAIEGLPAIEMDGWFVRRLKGQIIPALTRIGFDGAFAHLLFQTAASGWQTMGPFANQCIRLHPALMKNMKTVRGETISHGGSQSDPPWIILPRISLFLKEKHAAYLLCYLDHLAGEPESEVRRILTRIIIEFVGNYALKFRNSILPRCLIDSALFYGYEAMFWKNLRNPPPGFEDDLIFDHYLRWIKLLRTKCADLNEDMVQCIKQMETGRQKVMLTRDPAHPGDDGNMDLGGLFVTLRHGRPGTEAAIKFLGNWLYSFRKDSAGRLWSALLPAALNTLFSAMKIKFAVAPPQAQIFLRKFLLGLRESLTAKDVGRPENSIKPAAQFKFVVRRVQELVDGAVATLA
jgi:hypothetical protein